MKRKGLRGLVFFCLMVLLLCGLNDILCVKSPHGVDEKDSGDWYFFV